MVATSAWGAVLAEIPEQDEDDLVGRMAVVADGLGAESQSAGPARRRLTLYVASPGAAVEVRGLLDALLRERGLDPATCAVRVERVEDGRWAERYQASLLPFRLGRRFTVHPGAGRPETDRGRVPLVLVPGRAFGTGEHPTTRMCAEELERRIVPGSCWIDLGCGSGILSLVAARCGAARVLAIDTDVEAVAVAREVVRANGLAGTIVVRRGSTAGRETGAWDGIVANVSTAFFLDSAASLARPLRPGGHLIASGFPTLERREVRVALESAGLEEVGRRQREGWALLTARRPGE